MTCQAVGCTELAPWAMTLDFGAVEVEVFLCRRHEHELRLDDRAEGLDAAVARGRELAARFGW